MHFELFGSPTTDIAQVRAAVEGLLGCALEEHESAYVEGEYYRADLPDGESVVVKRNLDPFDQEPLEENFPEYPVLVYVDNTMRPSEIRSTMERQGDFVSLRQE
jgi:hypothetical protein